MRHVGKFRTALAVLAAATMTGAQAADAPADCLSEAEISALAIYVMPQLIAATQNSCKGQLSATGFLATEGAAMAQKYAARADAVWPQAKSAFMKFAGDSKSKDVQEFASLSDKALRPVIDELVVKKVGEEIHPKSCHDIERLAKALNAVDPDTTGALFSVIASLAVRDKQKPRVCEA
jgi:hypothetical protein